MLTSWQELYNENNRPERSALNDFWNQDIRQLFIEISNRLAVEYGLALTNLTYTKSNGWTFKFTKSGVVLVKKVIILNDAFLLDDIKINDKIGLETAYEYVKSLYISEFIDAYNAKIKMRNMKQSERSRRAAAQEKNRLEEVLKTVDKDKLNKFKWSPKVLPEDLKKLYSDDAKMRFNEELVDEIGWTFYARCLQGRDERVLANENKLKCHNCGKILIKTDSELLQCDCGYSYIFNEYMRSFNRNSMPSRSATPFFNEFIRKWPMARDYSEKMQLIDRVIHECHLNMFSGVKRGEAGTNLIHGSKKEVKALILTLAYSQTA
jgi:hypothetical protein